MSLNWVSGQDKPIGFNVNEAEKGQQLDFFSLLLRMFEIETSLNDLFMRSICRKIEANIRGGGERIKSQTAPESALATLRNHPALCYVATSRWEARSEAFARRQVASQNS